MIDPAAPGLVTGSLAGRDGDSAVGADGDACTGVRGAEASARAGELRKPPKNKATPSRRDARNQTGPSIRATVSRCFQPSSAIAKKVGSVEPALRGFPFRNADILSANFSARAKQAANS